MHLFSTTTAGCWVYEKLGGILSASNCACQPMQTMYLPALGW